MERSAHGRGKPEENWNRSEKKCLKKKSKEEGLKNAEPTATKKNLGKQGNSLIRDHGGNGQEKRKKGSFLHTLRESSKKEPWTKRDKPLRKFPTESSDTQTIGKNAQLRHTT